MRHLFAWHIFVNTSSWFIVSHKLFLKYSLSHNAKLCDNIWALFSTFIRKIKCNLDAGYTNPCNDPQRAPTGPNDSQRAPTRPNDLQRSKLLLQRPPTTQIITPTAPNDPKYYHNEFQRSKDKYYPSIRIPYAFLEKFIERRTYQNRYEVSKTYLRGKNFVGKNFRRQKFSSLAQNFVTFYRRKF